jgi:hypothetical protein
MTPHCQWTASPPGVSAAVAPAARRLDGTPAAPAEPDRSRWSTRAAFGAFARRPAPPVSRTELAPPCGGEPGAVRLATVSGTNEYRDRPGSGSWHSGPALRSEVAGVRMSVGCGSPDGPRLPPIASRVVPRPDLRPPPLSPRGIRRHEPHRSWARGVSSLDFENLMRVRPPPRSLAELDFAKCHKNQRGAGRPAISALGVAQLARQGGELPCLRLPACQLARG